MDHRGFIVKDEIIAFLEKLGHEVVDLGTNSTEPCDYPDIAEAVGEAVRGGQADRGIVVCGSGAGAVIAANKMKGIRATLAHDTYTAHQSVEHDDANVIAIGSMIIGIELIREVIASFLSANFVPEERYQRRLDKVNDLEKRG